MTKATLEGKLLELRTLRTLRTLRGGGAAAATGHAAAHAAAPPSARVLDAILRIVGVKVRFLLELVRLLLLLPLPSLLLLRVLLVLSFVRRPTVPSADPSRAASGSGTQACACWSSPLRHPRP